jgi:ribosome modulation factor
MKMSEAQRRAFNQGCDARLRGWPRNHNPYIHRTQEWKLWREGWEDVQCHWPGLLIRVHEDPYDIRRTPTLKPRQARRGETEDGGAPARPEQPEGV